MSNELILNEEGHKCSLPVCNSRNVQRKLLGEFEACIKLGSTSINRDNIPISKAFSVSTLINNINNSIISPPHTVPVVHQEQPHITPVPVPELVKPVLDNEEEDATIVADIIKTVQALCPNERNIRLMALTKPKLMDIGKCLNITKITRKNKGTLVADIIGYCETYGTQKQGLPPQAPVKQQPQPSKYQPCSNCIVCKGFKVNEYQPTLCLCGCAEECHLQKNT